MRSSNTPPHPRTELTLRIPVGRCRPGSRAPSAGGWFGILVLYGIAVDGQHGAVGILQFHAGRVDVELTG